MNVIIKPESLVKGKVYCVPTGYTTQKDVFVCIRTEFGIEYAVFANGKYPTDMVPFFYAPLSLDINRFLYQRTRDPKYL
jgi:hypothetical protein